MRKSVILFLICLAMLATPFAVRAQTAPTFEKLQIQLWPDYDQASVLVIYDFTVAAETSLPAQISLSFPKGAQFLAMAKEAEGGLVDVEHQLLEPEGKFNLVTFSVTDRVVYHFEYYLPYTRQGEKRSFSFLWPGDYAVKTASVRLQEPLDVTGLTTDPVLAPIGKQPDGYTYYARDLSALVAGQETVINVSYQKSSEALSVASQEVQSTLPLDQNLPGQSAYLSYLPWILGGLGVALLLIAGWVYWTSSRAGRSAPQARRRHAAAGSEVAGGSGKQVHCSQCGKRAEPGDRFCRTCGARIRRGED